ncbi:Hypothetical predicted protein [Olea europaea subsp. europaea]|uniref:Uncharacterized protein n=1 Tax=Olea europaea subsp. europaea TaxID=158383 RepID=A0A8S0TKU8_OLEEU|nr:Hypothetical predicted protein [Olea europaea subsp. europaea]
MALCVQKRGSFFTQRARGTLSTTELQAIPTPKPLVQQSSQGERSEKAFVLESPPWPGLSLRRNIHSESPTMMVIVSRGEAQMKFED